jgi:hypothetical protein
MKNGFKVVSEEYINVAFSIQNDLQLWRVFLPATIETYLEKYPSQVDAHSSNFLAYDIDSNSCHITETHDFNKSSEIKAQELKPSSQYFLQWVEVLSIVRLYSSIEELLLNSIKLKYYSGDSSLIKSRKHANNIKNKIQKELEDNNIDMSRINNRFLINFLKFKSKLVSGFFKCKTFSVKESSWEDFFEFISIIRHIIVHNGMIVSAEESSGINSRFKKMFSLYFQLVKSGNGHMVLRVNENTGVNNMISMCNEFALNTAKYIFGFDTFQNAE